MHSRLLPKRVTLFAMAFIIAGLCGVGPAMANPYSFYTDFTDSNPLPPGLTRYGSPLPTIVDDPAGGKMLQMTPDGTPGMAAAVWTQSLPIYEGAEIMTEFEFRMFRSDEPSNPADGLAFVVRDNASSPLGGSGGQMGYGGIQNALIIQFDSYPFNSDDPSDNIGDAPHMAIEIADTAGSLSLISMLEVEGYGDSNTFSNGDAWRASIWITSHAGSGSTTVRVVLVDLDATTAPWELTADIGNILDVLAINDGDLTNMGLTASTGARYSEQDILSWRLNVPEPSGMSLMVLAFGAAAIAKRRGRKM